MKARLRDSVIESEEGKLLPGQNGIYFSEGFIGPEAFSVNRHILKRSISPARKKTPSSKNP